MTTAPTSAPTASPVGKIHDLAYSRYMGPRLGGATRFLVIARYALRLQWRLLAVKLFMLASMLFMAIGAVSLGFTWAPALLLERAGPAASAMHFDAAAQAPLAVEWAFSAQLLPTFLLLLVCGAPSVAADLNAGAFQFHFSRPVDLTQYIAGRVLAAVAWAALMGHATVAVFCGLRYAMFHDLPSVAKLFAVGFLGVNLRLLTLGSIAIACSSLTRRKGLAQALFVGVVAGSAMLFHLLGSSMHWAWAGSVSPFSAAESVCGQLLGQLQLRGAARVAPSVALAAWVVSALALARWRVSRAEVMRG